MKKWHRIMLSAFVVFVSAVGLSLGTFFYSTTAAHAGNNGQMLQVTCSQATSIVVIGINQNNQPVSQMFSPDPGGGSTFTTNGYWWAGPVGILWFGPNGYGQSLDSVPQQQQSDIYQTDCLNPTQAMSINPGNCDPSTTTDPVLMQECLMVAPLSPAACGPNNPCIPYIDHVVMSTSTNSFFCALSSFNNGDSDNGEADHGDGYNGNDYTTTGTGAFTNSQGNETEYVYSWGYSYVNYGPLNPNGVPIYEWYQGLLPNSTSPAVVPGPLVILNSDTIDFFCNDPAS